MRQRHAQRGNADAATFEHHVSNLIEPAYALSVFANRQRKNRNFPCRHFLISLHTEATRLQELVDGYGAQSNEAWFPFRESIAAVKLFSRVAHNVLHIQKGIDHYRLLHIEGDFAGATGDVVAALKQAILVACDNLREQAKRCNVQPAKHETDFKPCAPDRTSFSLPVDRSVRHVHRNDETVVYLATQFLNLSEDKDVRTVLVAREEDEYDECIPDPMSEERLRIVEARFHNLQSLYDTYIFESDLERQTPDLPLLRGHASIIYHLLEVGTELSHYYIRHMSSLRRDTYQDTRFPMSSPTLQRILFGYIVRFAHLYLISATHLCRRMIREHSTMTKITVPIPSYRGFHVRPSTLIARIVAHYGSSVTMSLDDQTYDAASPLELFRANEAINAAKRRRIAALLAKRSSLRQTPASDGEERKRDVQLLLMDLVKEGHIVVYDTDLGDSRLDAQPGETIAELASRVVTNLMSLGKLDVRSTITVTFVGDNRALHDIEVLANNGYGEDKMGNNVVLPDELTYLSRQ